MNASKSSELDSPDNWSNTSNWYGDGRTVQTRSFQLLAVWEVDSDRLLLMVGLGFFGGIIIWVYDLAKSKINK